MNSTAKAALPCNGGNEWFNEDSRRQSRAGGFCGVCTLLHLLPHLPSRWARKAGSGGTAPLNTQSPVGQHDRAPQGSMAQGATTGGVGIASFRVLERARVPNHTVFQISGPPFRG